MAAESVMDAALPVEPGAEIYRLQLSGRLYSASTAALAQRFDQAMARGARTIILDCLLLEALDSAALSIIIEYLKKLKTKRGGAIIFSAPSAAIERILTLTKMDRFMPIAPDLAAAVSLARGLA